MVGDAQKYLNLISQHLQEHHAALLVGSGFSRNADKVSPDVKDSPLWGDLVKIFKQKLYPTQEHPEELECTDPLALAEYVEIAYGRPELDRLLLNSIRDSDYRPSQLHCKLLQLPWSDIFTTNYDTLLERASKELTEQSFSYVLSQNDLLGSSGTTRIIKLHGSFPSHRPFIITSEDYRTYPRKFAPFVNTVQQALLENTLCMIGFSGDDPNFNSWVGWIRDNLGTENAPYMYLLLHKPPSGTRQEWLRQRNIIVVDLSEMFPGVSAPDVYEKALDYLLGQYRKFKETRQSWTPQAPVASRSSRPLPIKDALPILRQNRETCPKMLTLPGGRIEYLRNMVISPASQILVAHCAKDKPDTENELEYLYEYDWLRTKALLPLFGSDLKCYQEILARYGDDHNAHKSSIQLSVLRAFREYAAWKEWEKLHGELLSDSACLTPDQRHQLRWEECLCSFSRYEFQQLKQQLESWAVPVDMTLWALRKAGLWAEYGKCEHAHTFLQQAILDVRRRLAHQSKPDPLLLSLESSMMYLQAFISQARQDSVAIGESEDGKQKEIAFIDEQHRAHHKQYHVSWEEQNAYFVPRLEAAWEPYRSHQIKASFDFGKTSTQTSFREDKDRILAFSFLRFREETGIPFHIRNVYCDKKAACGAAERIVLYMPQWAILTLVRTDEHKAVERTITRGVLSSWTQEEADQRCQFYLDAVLRTESELTIADWFYRNSFARLVADVLPEVLSEFCSKCSVDMLDKLLDLLEQIYSSPKKLCYQRTISLAKRLLPAFPSSARKKLVTRLIRFPLIEQEEEPMLRDFPDPFQYLPIYSDCSKGDAQTPVPEVQALLDEMLSRRCRKSILDRLLYCFYHGLLTAQQKILLGGLLWKNGKLQIPSNWSCTVCLEFPAPQDADTGAYLSEHFTEIIKGYSDNGGIRANNDEFILHELTYFALTNSSYFLPEQLSAILSSFSIRVTSLSRHLAGADDFMGIKKFSTSQLYDISRALWLLTACKERWTPTQEDLKTMADILDVCEMVRIRHHGLTSIWSSLLNRPFSANKNLERCLRSAENLCSYYAYDVLATAIHYPDHHFLSPSEIQAGVTVMAQQIAWCIPKQLTAALQTAVVTAQYQPELLNSDILELVLIGLSQMLEQTVITPDDTVESASEKGTIRKEAAVLIKTLHRSGLGGERQEVLDAWLKTIQDNNEFSEIRECQ